MGRKVRTNVVIDEELVTRVMDTYGLKSKKAAIDFALHAVLGEEDEEPITDPWAAALEMVGTWKDRSEEELRAIYGDEWPEAPER